jgi:hypothetical protein
MAPAHLPRKSEGWARRQQGQERENHWAKRRPETDQWTAVTPSRRSPEIARVQWTRIPWNRKLRMELDKQRSIGGDIGSSE